MIMAALGDNPALIGRYLATLGSLLATFFLSPRWKTPLLVLFFFIKKSKNDNVDKVI